MNYFAYIPPNIAIYEALLALQVSQYIRSQAINLALNAIDYWMLFIRKFS